MTLEECQKRVEQLEDRFERAKKHHYDVLGWGTHEEVSKAFDRARSARDALQKARKALQKLEAKQVMLQATSDDSQATSE